MKIILSRKGFDSKYGGHPSVVLPDGKLLSFPIPSSDIRKYSEIQTPRGRISSVFNELGISARETCHLDPDLCEYSLPRNHGWRPALGQIGSAQGHLENERVGAGDLFLFYGWFQQTREEDGALHYRRDEWKHGVHLLYGYLEIGEVLLVSRDTVIPAWLEDHPHCVSSGRRGRANNTVYIAAERLSWDKDLIGGGMFRYDPKLVLTKTGESRSRWALPPELFRNVRISYHSSRSWKNGYFQSRPIGQEFVIDATPAIEEWAKTLITNCHDRGV